MTKQPASGTDTALPIGQAKGKAPSIPTPIYKADADDPAAVQPFARAKQLCSMCRVLIRATDSNMRIELLEELPGQIEVMYQLADELWKHLDPNSEGESS